MIIVEPYARIMDPLDKLMGEVLLRKVEWIGRVSHQSEGEQTFASWERFLRSVILGHGDWSIAEHVHLTVDAVVDRGITHEWVRHRIGAYTQSSTRFINHAKKNTQTNEYVNPAKFICPPSILVLKETDKGRLYDLWVDRRAGEEQEYQALIAEGIKPQEARSVFPNALASRLISTYNLRNWRHFFLMRTTREAHPQMRQVTIPLLKQFQQNIPILFEDIEPEAKQSENLKKMR